MSTLKLLSIHRKIFANKSGFANNIFTTEGGIRGWVPHGANKKSSMITRKQGLPQGEREEFDGEDVREGLTAIISVKN